MLPQKAYEAYTHGKYTRREYIYQEDTMLLCRGTYIDAWRTVLSPHFEKESSCDNTGERGDRQLPRITGRARESLKRRPFPFLIVVKSRVNLSSQGD